MTVRQFALSVSLVSAVSIGAFFQSASADVIEQENLPPEQSPSQYICNGSEGYAQSFGGIKTYLWRPQWLIAIKNADPNDSQIKAIFRGADKALKAGVFSVADKGKLLPGATKNDYISVGPYWWPDPSKKDGLPYIRKDGIVNPERIGPNFDTMRMGAFANNVRDLTLAYYISGDEKYAIKAGELVRAWYITPETRMNPNFNFAQSVPGRSNGRAEGIIDASRLSTIIEAMGVLRTSKYALSEAEHKVVQSWYLQFANWLATSENGIEEMNKVNNHGMFYDYYLTHFSLYSGLDNVAKSVAEQFTTFRLGVQMDKRGRFMKELGRTRSWHYSHYVLEGAAKLATISECVGANLWDASTQDGRSMHTAISFVAKYWDGQRTWPFRDIDLKAGNTSASDSKAERRVRILFARSKGMDEKISPMP